MQRISNWLDSAEYIWGFPFGVSPCDRPSAKAFQYAWASLVYLVALGCFSALHQALGSIGGLFFTVLICILSFLTSFGIIYSSAYILGIVAFHTWAFAEKTRIRMARNRVVQEFVMYQHQNETIG